MTLFNSFSLFLTIIIFYSASLYALFENFEGYTSNIPVHYHNRHIPYEYDNNTNNFHINFLPECTAYSILRGKNSPEKIVMGPLHPCVAIILINNEKVMGIHKSWECSMDSITNYITREFPSNNEGLRVILHSTDMGKEYTDEWKKKHNNRTQKEELILIATKLQTLGIVQKNITINLFKPNGSLYDSIVRNITVDHSGKLRSISLADSGIGNLKTHSKFYFLGNYTEHITTNRELIYALASPIPYYVFCKAKLLGTLDIIKKETINCGNCLKCKQTPLPQVMYDYGFYWAEMSTIAVMIGLEVVTMQGLYLLYTLLKATIK